MSPRRRPTSVRGENSSRSSVGARGSCVLNRADATPTNLVLEGDPEFSLERRSISSSESTSMATDASRPVRGALASRKRGRVCVCEEELSHPIATLLSRAQLQGYLEHVVCVRGISSLDQLLERVRSEQDAAWVLGGRGEVPLAHQRLLVKELKKERRTGNRRLVCRPAPSNSRSGAAPVGPYDPFDVVAKRLKFHERRASAKVSERAAEVDALIQMLESAGHKPSCGDSAAKGRLYSGTPCADAVRETTLVNCTAVPTAEDGAVLGSCIRTGGLDEDDPSVVFARFAFGHVPRMQLPREATGSAPCSDAGGDIADGTEPVTVSRTFPGPSGALLASESTCNGSGAVVSSAAEETKVAHPAPSASPAASCHSDSGDDYATCALHSLTSALNSDGPPEDQCDAQGHPLGCVSTVAMSGHEVHLVSSDVTGLYRTDFQQLLLDQQRLQRSFCAQMLRLAERYNERLAVLRERYARLRGEALQRLPPSCLIRNTAEAMLEGTERQCKEATQCPFPAWFTAVDPARLLEVIHQWQAEAHLLQKTAESTSWEKGAAHVSVDGLLAPEGGVKKGGGAPEDLSIPEGVDAGPDQLSSHGPLIEPQRRLRTMFTAPQPCATRPELPRHGEDATGIPFGSNDSFSLQTLQPLESLHSECVADIARSSEPVALSSRTAITVSDGNAEEADGLLRPASVRFASTQLHECSSPDSLRVSALTCTSASGPVTAPSAGDLIVSQISSLTLSDPDAGLARGSRVNDTPPCFDPFKGTTPLSHLTASEIIHAPEACDPAQPYQGHADDADQSVLMGQMESERGTSSSPRGRDVPELMMASRTRPSSATCSADDGPDTNTVCREGSVVDVDDLSPCETDSIGDGELWARSVLTRHSAECDADSRGDDADWTESLSVTNPLLHPLADIEDDSAWSSGWLMRGGITEDHATASSRSSPPLSPCVRRGSRQMNEFCDEDSQNCAVLSALTESLFAGDQGGCGAIGVGESSRAALAPMETSTVRSPLPPLAPRSPQPPRPCHHAQSVACRVGPWVGLHAKRLTPSSDKSDPSDNETIADGELSGRSYCSDGTGSTVHLSVTGVRSAWVIDRKDDSRDSAGGFAADECPASAAVQTLEGLTRESILRMPVEDVVAYSALLGLHHTAPRVPARRGDSTEAMARRDLTTRRRVRSLHTEGVVPGVPQAIQRPLAPPSEFSQVSLDDDDGVVANSQCSAVSLIIHSENNSGWFADADDVNVTEAEGLDGSPPGIPPQSPEESAVAVRYESSLKSPRLPPSHCDCGGNGVFQHRSHGSEAAREAGNEAPGCTDDLRQQLLLLRARQEFLYVAVPSLLHRVERLSGVAYEPQKRLRELRAEDEEQMMTRADALKAQKRRQELRQTEQNLCVFAALAADAFDQLALSASVWPGPDSASGPNGSPEAACEPGRWQRRFWDGDGGGSAPRGPDTQGTSDDGFSGQGLCEATVPSVIGETGDEFEGESCDLGGGHEVPAVLRRPASSLGGPGVLEAALLMESVDVEAMTAVVQRDFPFVRRHRVETLLATDGVPLINGASSGGFSQLMAAGSKSRSPTPPPPTLPRAAVL